MNTSKVEQAASYFKQGFACSQAVFAAYAPSEGLPAETALKIGESFGGGMAMAETCGAVTGAFMLLGLKYGRTRAEDLAAKTKNRALVKEFVEHFKTRHGSITCKGLLGVDISTEQGRADANEKNLFQTLCPNLVQSAAEILEQLMAAK